MQNAAVARMFSEIADYLEVSAENTFKIRSYRKAAESISGLSEPIELLAADDRLGEISGLGPATTAKTKEFLATGTVRVLEALREKYPLSLLQLLRVPGLGPKKVSFLFHEKGVDSVEKLLAALDSNALEGVSGFGAKTLENLKTGVRRMEELSGRVPITEALPQAERLRETLAGPIEHAGLRIEIAGELRRGLDMVTGTSLVALTDDPANLIERLCALPTILEVAQRESHSATVRLYPGVQVEMLCSPAASFGSALFLATGTAEHCAAAAQLSAELGIDLLHQPSEEALYGALKAQFIAPELREGRGEWEAALAGQLPTLLEVADIRGDLHAHSTWSDGRATILEMAQAALSRGYEYLAITDHSKALAMTGGLDAARLREQRHEIEAAQAALPKIRILRGIECDILRDGSLDLDDEVLAELDIVLASVHSAFHLDQATQTARIIRAISHPAVRIVAHPTGRVLGVRPPYEVDLGAIIEAARETGTALEINSSDRLDLSDANARMAREAGVILAIDTDAHAPGTFADIRYGVATARRAWCTSRDILNTKPLAQLLDWLKR